MQGAEEAAKRNAVEAKQKYEELKKAEAEAQRQKQATLEPQKSLAAPYQRAIETSDLIRNARVALKILGCYGGTASGTLDGATTQAIKTYFARASRESREATVTKDLLDELEKPMSKGSPCIARSAGQSGTKVKKAKLPTQMPSAKPQHKAVATKLQRVAEPAAKKSPSAVVPANTGGAAAQKQHMAPQVPF